MGPKYPKTCLWVAQKHGLAQAWDPCQTGVSLEFVFWLCVGEAGGNCGHAFLNPEAAIRIRTAVRPVLCFP